MPSEPRTLFVIINESRLEVSAPNTTMFHDQWFIKEAFTDENMTRRFLDMHVRGYYKDHTIHFYRSPTFIYDNQDIEVMLKFIDPLLAKLTTLCQVKEGQPINLYAGRGHNSQLIKTLCNS
ncbi:hypothetical protein COV81_04545 [Candidatus Peregrinibacteria bacterium CG11_big_fil_rev_8_21_14_0_20_41_10]|nr:MAG: hypothetical protein COV81_04545 [Candidatus Peregrinibacteria bacterium CG11_big_fil_rev_8_21_14_0_20_41_10]